MRVALPLSLKVSLWLMLNLVLLAGLGIGFFVVQGGLGWDALVSGPTGDRVQALFNIIAGEVSAASGEARHAVLKRLGTASHVQFYLIGFDETPIAGETVVLPPEVRERMEFRPPGFGRPFGPRGDGRRPGEGELEAARRREAPPEGTIEGGERKSREYFERARRGGEGGFFSGPTSRLTGRFVVRAGTPAAYWVGTRVPFAPAERNSRMMPAKLVARVGSLWGLLNLLGLQAWLLASGGVLLLSVFFWLPLVRSITHSIGQLTTATERIAEGRFDTRVDATRRDELGKLGESVNRMAARIDAHMNGQKRFLGDVAHELCSPIARLQMATGILADQAPPGLQDTVSDVREEVQQMSTLVNELLAFTKAGLQPRAAVLAPVALEPLAREILAREDAGDGVSLTIDPEVRVMAEPDLLGRALGNLVRNAVRYAGQAGPITVSAHRQERQVVLVVEDVGPGVPPGDLDRLGEPFFRPELARTREGGGVGLGLAIVRNSIAACGGEVRFSNRDPHGFRAEVRLAAA